MSEILFEDFFEVKDIDPHKDASGKTFDKVSRIVSRSENYEMDLHLDVHCELYPFEINQKFTFVLTKTLNLDGKGGDDGTYDQSGKKTLADQYEYVMYGKVYKWEEEKATAGAPPKVYVFASFGGLLMCLKGDARHLEDMSPGVSIYLLMRKASK